jgi:hypothetical protein
LHMIKIIAGLILGLAIGAEWSVRVPSAAFLRRCDRTVLLDTDPIESAMDTGG